MDWLYELYNACVNFFNFMGKFIQDLSAGVTYVSNYLLDAPSQISEALVIMPAAIVAPVIVLFGILVTLALVRWIA